MESLALAFEEALSRNEHVYCANLISAYTLLSKKYPENNEMKGFSSSKLFDRVFQIWISSLKIGDSLDVRLKNNFWVRGNVHEIGRKELICILPTEYISIANNLLNSFCLPFATLSMDSDNHELACNKPKSKIVCEISGDSIISHKRSRPRVETETKHIVKKKKENDDPKDNNDWLCCVCNQFDTGDSAPLLLCDGKCLRSFHTTCMGLDCVPDGLYYCERCVTNTHPCFICNEDPSEDNPTINCREARCGKFYHKDCVVQSGLMYVLKVGSKSTCADEDDVEYQLTCPYHFCDTCYSYYHGKTGVPNCKCIHCPRAFHINCIEPGSRFNEWCLVCSKHPHAPLPSLDNSEQREKPGNMKKNLTGKKTSKDADMVTSEILFWDNMQLDVKGEPQYDNIYDSHFMLPITIQSDVERVPPPFKEILRLDYDTFPGKEKGAPLFPLEDCCECKPVYVEDGVRKGGCDENCFNRLVNIECYDDICNAKGDCGNRQLQNRNYVKVQAFSEPGRGWGLKASEYVPKGTLVIEYIGEVIDKATVVSRMENQRKYTPNDHDFYIMELGNGAYVDGKFKGNYSRFINHSCDPNCVLVPTNVKGRMRIGIFALRDIQKDEPLSYDYRFETQEADAFKCLCGSANCRGTMAPERKKAKFLNIDTLSKSDRAKLMDIAKNLDKKEEPQLRKENWERCCYLSKFLPRGVKEICTNEVRHGAVRSLFPHARIRRIFLPRNVRKSISVLTSENDFTGEKRNSVKDLIRNAIPERWRGLMRRSKATRERMAVAVKPKKKAQK